MTKNEKQTFRGISVVLDGNQFFDCRFERCEIVYAGGEPPTLVNNGFTECQWAFRDAAGRTLSFLGAMYAGGMQQLIEDTFNNIRGKPAAGVTIN